MKFEELEKLVNEKIEELNLSESKLRHEECAYEVKKILNEIVGGSNDFYFDCGYGCNGNVILKSRKSYDYSIEIKIRRKKNGFEYLVMWGMVNYYGIKKIEIQNYYDDVDSIDSFLERVNEGIRGKKEYKEKMISDFEEMLESNGISFEKFYEIMEKYQRIDYSDKIKIAEKYMGEKYYCYIGIR